MLVVGAGSGRPGLRDPVRTAARRRPRYRRAAGRSPPGRARQGQAAGLAPPVGCGGQPAVAHDVVRRFVHARRHPELRAGGRRVGVRPDPRQGPADPAPAPDAQPRQRHRLAVRAGPMDGRSGRGARARCSSPRRRPRSCSSTEGRVVGVRTGDKGRAPDGTELPELRAGLGHRGAGDRAGRGHPGPSDRRGARPLRPAARELPRSRSSASRRCGGSPSRSTGSSTPWAGRCARRPSTASSAGRSSTRWGPTWSPSAWWSGSTTATSSCRCTTCSRS